MATILKVSRVGFMAGPEYGIFSASIRTRSENTNDDSSRDHLVGHRARRSSRRPPQRSGRRIRRRTCRATQTAQSNLTAPAPRTADGKPDLTGLWEIYFNSIAPPPPPGQASPSRSLQDSSDSGADQLGIQTGGPPPDPERAAARDVLRHRRATSKAARRFKTGRATCARSAWPTTRRTIPTRTACRWASCSCTAIRSRARSCRRPSSS